jgi:hypothetical protein
MASEKLRQLRIRVIIDADVAGDEGGMTSEHYDKTWTFADGSGSYQAQSILYDDSRSLAGTSETIDLDAQADKLGSTDTDITGIKVMMFENLNTDPGTTLTIGGGDFSPMFADPTDKLVLKAGGFALIVSPIDKYAETASTGDGLLIANSTTGLYRYFLATTNT